MDFQRRLWLLSFVAQYQRLPSSCTHEERSQLIRFIRIHAWPHIVLTTEGWAVIDQAGRQALHTRGSSGTDAA
jgi:hypothetical protein